MRRAHAFIAVAAALLAAGAAGAQGVIDPTRPPPGWLPSDQKAAGAGKPKAEPEDHGSVPVQILLVGKTRRFALIRGEAVGEKTSGMKLVEVKPSDVVIQSEHGRETLNLFPDVKKTPPKKPAGMGQKEQQ